MRILLVRHGLSQTNVDRTLHKTTANHAVQLTETGFQQAKDAGIFIRRFYENLIEEGKLSSTDHIRLWRSSFTRTRQTAENIMATAGMKANGGVITDWRESDRIRE